MEIVSRRRRQTGGRKLWRQYNEENNSFESQKS